MIFEDFTRHLAGSLNVTIAADALYALWGVESGPQDAEGIVQACWSHISAIAFDKVTNGDLEPDNTVLITEADLEGGDGGGDIFRIRADAGPPSGRWFGDIENDDVPW